VINLALAQKTLPLRITKHNIESINLISFQDIQRSLIAFLNDDRDELFHFYDELNKRRLLKLRKQGERNSEEIDEVKATSQNILEGITTITGDE
jgi:hypothetical protein